MLEHEPASAPESHVLAALVEPAGVQVVVKAAEGGCGARGAMGSFAHGIRMGVGGGRSERVCDDSTSLHAGELAGVSAVHVTELEAVESERFSDGADLLLFGSERD